MDGATHEQSVMPSLRTARLVDIAVRRAASPAFAGVSQLAPAEPNLWRSAGDLTVLGTGSALPGAPVTTRALLEALAPWLATRERERAEAVAMKLGVATRHSSRAWRARVEAPEPGGSNPELAARAVRAALTDAGVRVGDLGYLIGHTATPAQLLPGNIAFVADELGYAGPHVELRQACTGFANALMIAFGLLSQPGARPVAIVGSETGSAFLDPERLGIDPGQIVNLVQMGDGAGAIVLGPSARGRDRLHAAWFGAMGLGRAPGLEMREGGSAHPADHDGPLQFAHDFKAINATGRALFDAGARAAATAGMGLDAADRVIPHQVSGRIGTQLAEHLGIAEDRFFVNADRVGNTGSAAIWLALDEMRGSGTWPGHCALVLGAEATKHMHGGFVLETA